MCLSMQAAAAQTAPAAAAAAPAYDAELAKSLGGNDNGLRSYVLVILKTGPNKVADAEERKKMFQGHFANMERLAAEKKLAFAGPLDGVEGRRGIFILATQDIEVAKTYVATDPVIISGEMVAEYHKLYGSAALMMVNDAHHKIIRKK
ncbi:hypothetical protein CR105_07110 [Massilia eurypsychrophila]|uniref:YCII-related domain-containing protein n=2 Tax=Massilia eurypsychrophila TaxID=1485217 RepID=A0A2G8TIH0_9BURK|nr:hypothetical protein CR105_07110 [Massilia eurypsychrophila]